MQQKILIVDDHKPIHKLIKTLLADEPLDVYSALGAEYGIALASSIQPDLVLLDVDMPDMNGFEACRLLKADRATASLPVMFLSGSHSTDERIHGLQLGAIDFISKPCDQDELTARMRGVLGLSRQIHELKDKALVDPLTGLGNRAMFDQRMASELALRVRFHTPVACIVLDIDNFRAINDTFGHHVGDEALRKIAGVMGDFCRVEDIACRYEGDKFVIVTPHATATDAGIIAEQIRTGILNSEFSHDSKPIELTCSIGVADALDRCERSMFHRADAAMYYAKQTGGNQVRIASSQEASGKGDSPEFSEEFTSIN